MSKPQPESILKRHVFQYLCMQKEFYGFYANNGATFDPTRGVFRSRNGLGSRRGISDIVGMWQGTAVAIEIKTPTGRLSEDQKRFQEEWIAHGGLAVTIRSVDEIVDWVDAVRLVSNRHLREN